MSRRILLSLVSDQTIPNIELIKEKQGEIEALLFITTAKMEKNGNRYCCSNCFRKYPICIEVGF